MDGSGWSLLEKALVWLSVSTRVYHMDEMDILSGDVYSMLQVMMLR